MRHHGNKRHRVKRTPKSSAARNGGIIPSLHKKRRIRRARQTKAIALQRSRESIPGRAKTTKGISRRPRKFSPDKAERAVKRNGASVYRRRTPAFRNPKTELEAAIQRFVDLYDFAPIAYVSFDRTGRIEEANLAATELLGEPRDLLIGRPFAFYVADLDLFMRHLFCCCTSQQQVKTELQLKPRKGERIPAVLCSTPITSMTRNGALLYQTAIVDLSDRKRAEEALRAREADLEAVINRTPFMFTRCSRDLRYRFVSRAYAKMLGRTPEEIAGKSIVEIMGEPGWATIQPYVNRVLLGETVNYEAEISFPKIAPRFLRGVYLPDQDEQGKVIGWIASLMDVTEQKRAEDALAEAARQEHVLYEFVQRQHEAKALREIYAASLDAILAALRCDRAAILLFDSEKQMRFVDWRGLSQGYRNAVEGHSPWKPDVRNPQPVCIADVDLADIPKSLKSTIRDEGIGAVAFIPLVSGRTLIGKFMTYYNAPHQFTNDELKLATTIARQLVQAIQRKRAEEALELESRLPAENPAPVIRLQQGRVLSFANPAAKRLLSRWDKKLGDQAPAQITNIACASLAGGNKQYLEIDSANRSYSVSVCPVRHANYVNLYFSEITERKRVEDALQRSKELLEERVHDRTRELRAANRELKAEIERRKGLEGEILEISDREQQRLGQEIHDGLCQHLTAVAFMARSVALRLKNHRVIEVGDIEKIAQLVNDAATDTRNLSRALHRIDVDSAGFITALEDLVDREIWQIPCRLEVKRSFHIEDDVAAGELYRIAREAVINANKHSEAREIVITLERTGKEMVLRVIDDGVGFPSDPKTKRGLGAHIMGYRARLMGARLEIDSPKGGGTRVSCYLPDKAVQLKKGKNNRTTPWPGKITKALPR